MSSVVSLNMAYPFRGLYSRSWVFGTPRIRRLSYFGNPQLSIITLGRQMMGCSAMRFYKANYIILGRLLQT